MTEGPLVTVGIPFFDEERFLGDAIRSVLAQTFADFELLLVDDGSSDRSLEIARSFGDPRVKVSSDGTRRRLAARLNEIVRTARGSYVARMDADDLMHPRRLERQMDVLRNDPSRDAVGTWALVASDDGEAFAVVDMVDIPETKAAALARGVLPHATMIAKRSWLSNNPYDETLSRAEDRDLWCRTVGSANFAIVPECLYMIRPSLGARRFLGDYVETHRDNRRIFSKYGPRDVGRLSTLRLIAASHAKSLVMRALVTAGVTSPLLRRRGRPPTDAERAAAREILEAVGQRA